MRIVVFPISLKLNFTPNILGCYGLIIKFSVIYRKKKNVFEILLTKFVKFEKNRCIKNIFTGDAISLKQEFSHSKLVDEEPKFNIFFLKTETENGAFRCGLVGNPQLPET